MAELFVMSTRKPIAGSVGRKDGRDMASSVSEGAVAGTHPAEPQQPGLPLLAYRLCDRSLSMPLVPAATRRTWMDLTFDRVANRCLPMVIANQCGWFVLNSHSFKVRWSGENNADALRIFYISGDEPYPATSVFGHGILTFHIPYLFRTPAGYNILARGPANWPKDGATALEGLVETDWTPATFTMNWQITRAGQAVLFEKNEPICMIVPQCRGELERFRPKYENIESDVETSQNYYQWARSRREFIGSRKMRPADAEFNNYQNHYLRGTSPDGVKFWAHQTAVRLREFRRDDDGVTLSNRDSTEL
jgi:hypothetical protein